MMTAPKQGHLLNGAHYGSKLRASPHDHFNQRARRMVIALLELTVVAVLLLCIVVLAVMLLLRPRELQFEVQSAYLSRFNLANTTHGVLDYSLKLVLTISNTNTKIAICHDEFEAVACYGGHCFGLVRVPAFYQEAGNVTVVYATFIGQSTADLDASAARGFKKQSRKGLFLINIKLYTKMRFRVGHLKLSEYSPKIKCDLVVPLASPSRSSGGVSFTRTKCDVKILN